jgi:hypothetical protein
MSSHDNPASSATFTAAPTSSKAEGTTCEYMRDHRTRVGVRVVARPILKIRAPRALGNPKMWPARPPRPSPLSGRAVALGIVVIAARRGLATGPRRL